MTNSKSLARPIARTAVLLAVLIALQWATKPLGQIVTGSCVNAVLAIAVLAAGLGSGLWVAAISPFAAFLLGIGPALFPLTPVIALGNGVYVLGLHLLAGRGRFALGRGALAVAVSAGAKALTLYLLVVQGVCRILPLQEGQIRTFTAMFSLPQLITALLGGALALLVVPALLAARKK